MFLSDQRRPEIKTAIDFLPINASTIRKSYPLEYMNKIVEWLWKRNLFSTADMKDGYWEVPLRPSDSYLTAVKTSVGLTQFTKMEIELRHAGTFYHRVIEKTLMKSLWKITVANQDDVSVATNDASRSCTMGRYKNTGGCYKLWSMLKLKYWVT